MVGQAKRRSSFEGDDEFELAGRVPARSRCRPPSLDSFRRDQAGGARSALRSSFRHTVSPSHSSGTYSLYACPSPAITRLPIRGQQLEARCK